MIDNISLAAYPDKNLVIYNEPERMALLGRMNLIGIPNLTNFSIYNYRALYKNLLFRLGNETLNINNSLHKFVLGENYSDFTMSKLQTAVKAIENLTDISASKYTIHKCELGLNIETVLPGKEYLSMFSLCNFEKAQNMMHGKTKYGIKYIFTEYSLKIYDKAEHYRLMENRNIDKNMLRFEVEYKKGRRLKEICLLSDLSDYSKVLSAFENYFMIINKVKCVEKREVTLLDRNEMALYFAGQNEEYWSAEKRRDKEGMKYTKNLYKKTTNKVNEQDLMPYFISCLKHKLQQLLNN